MPSYFGLNVSQSPQNIWSITVIYFLVCCSVVRGQTATQPNGAGTSVADPYLITNLSELYWISSNNNVSVGFNTKYFKLVNDIDASATSDPAQWPNGWIAIGNSSANAFKGNFDGQGYSITGMRIINSSNNAVHGFFGIVSGATISNLKLNIVLDFSNHTSSVKSGGLASMIQSSSFVQDVHVTIEHIFPPDASGNYDGNLTLLGGFVGQSNSSTFKDCSLIGKPLYMSSYRSGGFVGASASCVFRRCFSDVEIYDLLRSCGIPDKGLDELNRTGGTYPVV